jgi:2'-5' RNA ligase
LRTAARQSRVESVGETAIVVIVPEAEPAVGALYRTHTNSGREAMPPHVTLLIPFADSEALPLAALRAALAAFEPFHFELAQTHRFEPSSGPILWLAPEPAAPFIELTEALVRAFPAYRPYGGAFHDIVPHLTVAAARDAHALDQIERELASALPIAARAEAATVVRRRDGDRRWEPHTTIPFGHV